MPPTIPTQLILLVIITFISLILLIRSFLSSTFSNKLATRISTIEQIISTLPSTLREEAHLSRNDLQNALSSQNQILELRFNTLEQRLIEFGKRQEEQLSRMRQEAADGRAKLEDTIQRSVNSFAHTQTTRLHETNDAVRSLSDRLSQTQEKGIQEQKENLHSITETIRTLTNTHIQAQDKLRDTVSNALERLQKNNSEKLESMRATVEEKLQGTLEKRLGESFQLVSDRLEQVHKGLGEMQNLATGVGDLKRVLSNVKARGGWGEAQLGMLLEDMLTPDQYDKNVKIRPDSNDIVEYAVRLPGQNHSPDVLWLPIDAKFPHEDYERLLQAQDTGNPNDVERTSSALEKALRQQAKLICEKYIHPPHSTDFAIMYLPTEGLFAEMIRRPGLTRDIQNKYRVMVQGPTTLAALLTSLQMGFRTLAIEKHSSEVWQILGNAKTEFMKYGQVWEKLSKQLTTAQNTVIEAGKRTRAVERKLRSIETLEGPDTDPSDAFKNLSDASDETDETNEDF